MHTVMLWGHDWNKPMSRTKRTISKKAFTFFNYLNTLTVGILIKPQRINSDYSHWLGPDYRHTKVADKFRSPTIVSNHTSHSDIYVLNYTLSGENSFLSADFVAKIPAVPLVLLLTPYPTHGTLSH